MAASTLNRTRRLLTGCLLTLLVASAAFSVPADSGAEAREDGGGTPAPVAAQSPAPAPTPPTRPNSKYVCDWKWQRFKGMTEVRLEYTRQLPQNGWLGKLHTRFQDKTTRVENIQLFAPRAIPRVGTEWSYQTTDGKVRCKLTVTRGGGEIKLGNCSNGAEQQCVDQRVIEVLEALPDPPCGECRPLGLFDKVHCLNRCLPRESGHQVDMTPCFDHPAGCMAIRWAQYFDIMIGGSGRDWLTQRGLGEMWQNWIDFNNQALGPCTSSHLCPGFTSCQGGQCTAWTNLLK